MSFGVRGLSYSDNFPQPLVISSVLSTDGIAWSIYSLFYGLYGQELFFDSKGTARPVPGPTKPPVQWVPSSLPQLLKHLALQTDHESLSPPEVTNACSNNFTSKLPACSAGRLRFKYCPNNPFSNR
jgi:hypothetical protein